MNTISSFITAFLILCSAHPLHVSVTEIEFDEKDKALEIMMRVFADDLEKTLRVNLKQPELDIFHPNNGMTLDQMAGNYIQEHFKIALDSKPQKTHFLGHEVDGEAIIFYIEVSNVKKWKTIQVRNDLHMEMFEDQSNLVHVTVAGTVRSLRLTKTTPIDNLTFDSK